MPVPGSSSGASAHDEVQATSTRSPAVANMFRRIFIHDSSLKTTAGPGVRGFWPKDVWRRPKAARKLSDFVLGKTALAAGKGVADFIPGVISVWIKWWYWELWYYTHADYLSLVSDFHRRKPPLGFSSFRISY